MSSGIELIAAERQRQIDGEGWTTEHDDGHAKKEMAAAATCYVMNYACLRTNIFSEAILRAWPWPLDWWKPKNSVRDLVRAGALIAAEIDRLQRIEAQP